MPKIRARYSFNEFTDAEEILKNGFPDGILKKQKMYLLAKYFRTKYGYGEKRLKRELISFCKSQEKDFNPIIEAGEIDKWVRNALKHEARRIEKIYINRDEVGILSTIKDIKTRKLLFSMLVLSKAFKSISKGSSDKYYINYSNFRDIADMSGIEISDSKMADLLSPFDDGLLTFYNPEKELVRLNFVFPYSPKLLAIEDFTKVMVYFEKAFGGHRCSDCGVEIVKTGNKKKYCSGCASIREKKRKANLKIKQKGAK